MADKTELELVCEIDEQWSYVGSKANQRWLWYAWSPHFKTVHAYAFGPRKDSVLTTLLKRLGGFKFRLYCTDDRGTYERSLPVEKHLITKKCTQSIERQNLNFPTRIKRLTKNYLFLEV